MIQCPDPGDNTFLHVGRSGSHHHRHCSAERFLASDCQHRHSQTGTCGKPGAIVGRVLLLVAGFQPRPARWYVNRPSEMRTRNVDAAIQ